MYKATVKINLENITTQDNTMKVKNLEETLIKVFTPSSETHKFGVENIEFELSSISAAVSKQKVNLKKTDEPLLAA